VDIVRRSFAELVDWKQHAQDTVPITGITADLELAEVLAEDRQSRVVAHTELAALAAAARIVGAQWVRLMARTSPGPDTFDLAAARVPDVGLPILFEPHASAWWTRPTFDALAETLAATPHLRLLVDTAQAHRAQADDRVLATAMRYASVLHICDNGTGLHAVGHRRAARHALNQISSGQPLAVAVEWTGPDRSPAGFNERYRSVCAWWSARRAEHTNGDVT